MPTTTYTVFDGEILSDDRAGTERDYVPDPLGSTVALLDSSQNQTDTFSYWPYGEESSRTGTTETPFRWGAVAYYRDTSSRSYAIASYFSSSRGRWTEVHAGRLNGYSYEFLNPTSFLDSGDKFWKCFRGLMGRGGYSPQMACRECKQRTSSNIPCNPSSFPHFPPKRPPGKPVKPSKPPKPTKPPGKPSGPPQLPPGISGPANSPGGQLSSGAISQIISIIKAGQPISNVIPVLSPIVGGLTGGQAAVDSCKLAAQMAANPCVHPIDDIEAQCTQCCNDLMAAINAPDLVRRCINSCVGR
jgi:hypothetical protein